MNYKMIRIIEENQPDLIHISHPNGASGAVTLCGWTDVPHKEVPDEGLQVNCRVCHQIIEFVHGIPEHLWFEA